MTRTHSTRTTLAALAGLGALALLAGCASGAEAPAEAEATEDVPHGYVEGADEMAEPQSRLVVADADGEGVQVLDLITEEVTDLDPVGPVDGAATDGRFAYLSSSDDGMTHIVDSGAWTVDHGDHQHYYRTGVRSVGPVEGPPEASVAADPALTVLTGADGPAALLDREALEEGSVAPSAWDGGAADGVVVPYAGHVVVAEGGAGGGVRVHDREGERRATLEPACTAPEGQAVTRRGLVIGCAEGALLVTEDDDALTGEMIAYPGEASDDERARAFHHRPTAATLAAPTDGDGVLVLDLAERAWHRWDLPGAVAVTAVGEGASVLALTDDGVLRSLDPETGEENAATALLDRVDEEHPPTIQVDTGRAYVNDAHGGLVHEIDYNDDLRVARTFETGVTPHHMVETGR